MAHSRPSSRLWLASVAAASVLGGLANAPALAVVSLDKCRGKIEVESDKLATNLKSNVTELPNVVITGCDARIQARKASATSVDFADSKWTFDGEVRIRMDQPAGNLKSDRAIVAFRNNQIESVTITGTPAEFEQTRGESKGTARGRAGKIVYDFSAGTVTLSDDAWFSDGGREITSAQVVYDLNQQQANATSKVAEDGKRVKITINPQATKQNGASPTPAPPTGQNTSRGTAPAASPAPATP